MWFGTLGGGLSRYDGVTWTSLDTRDGLPSNVIRSIYEDSDYEDSDAVRPMGGSRSERFFWFSTEEGLVRYRPSTTRPSVRIVSVKLDEEYTRRKNACRRPLAAHRP